MRAALPHITVGRIPAYARRRLRVLRLTNMVCIQALWIELVIRPR